MARVHSSGGFDFHVPNPNVGMTFPSFNSCVREISFEYSNKSVVAALIFPAKAFPEEALAEKALVLLLLVLLVAEWFGDEELGGDHGGEHGGKDYGVLFAFIGHKAHRVLSYVLHVVSCRGLLEVPLERVSTIVTGHILMRVLETGYWVGVWRGPVVC